MSIMIGIDETLADHAARIGTRHYDDDNNSCGARAPCALPGGSVAFRASDLTLDWVLDKKSNTGFGQVLENLTLPSGWC